MTKIIVEVCQNHNGDRTVLADLIKRAAEAGADIVKGQIIFSDDLTHRARFDEGEEEPNGVRKTLKRPYTTEYARLKGLDLKEEDYFYFVEECYRAGVIPMLSVFSRNRVELAARLPWKSGNMVKVASYDCASRPFIRELAAAFDKFIISTGATFDPEIEATAQMLNNMKKSFAFLHCVTSYPNSLGMANLKRMGWLRQFTPEVGWSDHSLTARDGLKLSKVAAMLGADYIERHFTVLSADKTKDGPVSINQDQLRELTLFVKKSKEEQQSIVARDIPEWQQTLGNQEREMTHTEMLNRDYYRGRFASRVWVENWDENAF